MKTEKLIILGVMAVFIISGLLLKNDKLAMFGLLALISYASIAVLEFQKKVSETGNVKADEVKDLKGEIAKKNELISEIQDRLSKVELAMGFRKNTNEGL